MLKKKTVRLVGHYFCGIPQFEIGPGRDKSFYNIPMKMY